MGHDLCEFCIVCSTQFAGRSTFSSLLSKKCPTVISYKMPRLLCCNENKLKNFEAISRIDSLQKPAS